MKTNNDNLAQHPESGIEGVLAWLAKTNGSLSRDDSQQLFQQIRQVRAAPIPTAQRRKLLDIFYAHTEHLVHRELPELQQISLPISRRTRHRVRTMQELLESLTQDYLNTLSEFFDPEPTLPGQVPAETLQKILKCISWNIQISHLAAAPTPIGLWLELHGAMNSAHRLGCGSDNTLEQIYIEALLAAIAQPASFNSQELDFITQCIKSLAHTVALSKQPPADSEASFWIDPAADCPAHAVIRRPPPADARISFFSCKILAKTIQQALQTLAKGKPAQSLKLPPMAETAAGQEVLRRLIALWGSPSKRRFTRRRQSYRANICVGLEELWPLLRQNAAAQQGSEWMVINESPDGYAVMHVAGETGQLLVGDIVAIQPHAEGESTLAAWHICIVRWAISENPEHLELGLQIVSSHAMAAVIVQPQKDAQEKINGLLIPEAPPVRQSASLIVETGSIDTASGKLVVLVERGNLAIREVAATHRSEHTNRIEIFNVEPDVTD